MCRVLGYRCKIVIPEDMPGARIEQIRAYGAEVEPAPRGRYIGGLVGVIRDYLKTASRQYAFTNHSLDTTFGPAAMEELANEALEQLATQDIGAPDYFVCALGNGISANGVSRVLVERGTRIIGMEPVESPTVLREYFPDEFKARYPQGHADRRHQIYGTGPGEDASVVFPNVVEVAPRLSTVMLPDPQEWRSTQQNLLDLEAQHVGNSSAACVWAALKLAEEVPRGSTIFTIFYDAYWRYLPLQAAVDADERELHPRDQLDAGDVAATALGLRP
jgi:cysteine synthase A